MIKPITLTLYLDRVTSRFKVYTTDEHNDRGSPLATLYLEQDSIKGVVPTMLEVVVTDLSGTDVERADGET